MSPEEINEAVARGLGWEDSNFPVPGKGWMRRFISFNPETVTGEAEYISEFPDYCHDISAAWEVVPTAHSFSLYRNHATGIWLCQMSNGEQVQTAEADTAPMAICLAFLQLLQKKG